MIELTDVSKVYRPERPELAVRALDRISLQIPRGQYVSLIGPSGSGKSSLMHILGCMDLPTSGRYMFNGTDVTRASADEVAAIRGRSIGFVFQSFHLIARMTAIENVELPLLYARRADRRERALAALARVGLADRGSHLPTELSGGQKQRVAIARAMVTHPPLLLADEPTGALDSATGREVMHLMETLLEDGATLILITHDATLAKRAQRVVVLRDGRIAADGPPSTVYPTRADTPEPNADALG